MNDVDIVLMDFLLCLSHLDLIPSNSIHLIAYERYLQKAGGKQTLCSHQQSTWPDTSSSHDEQAFVVIIPVGLPPA